MREDIKNLWVEALLSGKYLQTTGKLAQAAPEGPPTAFCCLGVLCELAVERGIAIRESPYIVEGKKQYITRYDTSTGVLPLTVQVWAGMSSDNGTIANTGKALSNLNDKGMRFDEIADLIENNWETL